MRTVTMKELDALSAAIDQVRAKMAELTAKCIAVPTIMNANPGPGALPFGIQSTVAIQAEADAVYALFEGAAKGFLGEGRRAGETFREFFDRVGAMSVEELLAAPVRNGLKLRL